MSGQGYRTRHGWTTSEAGGVNHRSWCPAVMFEPPELCGCGAERAPTPNRFVRDDPPAWVWAAVLAITAALIFLLVYLEAVK